MARPPKKERPLVVLGMRHDLGHVRGVVEIAQELDWHLFDLNINKGQLPLEMRPEGAILSDLPDSPLVLQLQKMGCLCVRQGNFPHPLDAELPAVMPDSEAIGRMAADHFASRGFKHVGYLINEPRDDFDRKPVGFQEQASRMGMEFHALRKPRVSVDKGYDALLENWFREVPKPFGVLGYHDTIAVSALTTSFWQS